MIDRHQNIRHNFDHLCYLLQIWTKALFFHMCLNQQSSIRVVKTASFHQIFVFHVCVWFDRRMLSESTNSSSWIVRCSLSQHSWFVFRSVIVSLAEENNRCTVVFVYIAASVENNFRVSSKSWGCRHLTGINSSLSNILLILCLPSYYTLHIRFKHRNTSIEYLDSLQNVWDGLSLTATLLKNSKKNYRRRIFHNWSLVCGCWEISGFIRVTAFCFWLGAIWSSFKARCNSVEREWTFSKIHEFSRRTTKRKAPNTLEGLQHLSCLWNVIE